MSSMAAEYNAINLGQGYPDFPMNQELVEYVAQAMKDGWNQYTHMAGYMPLREAIAEKIEFFIDPSSGMVFSHKDIENYYKRMSVPPIDAYFKPLSNKRVIQHLLEEISRCFDNDKDHYKFEELLILSKLLD